MNLLLKDVLYAVRALRKNPSFTAIAVLSLALGIGANTAIFSLTDRVLLRSLPVKNPGELVLLTSNGPYHGSVMTAYDSDYVFSYPMYRDFRDRAPAFNGVIAWFPVSVSLSANGTTELIQSNLVTGNYFEVLGAKTILGRPILPEDDRIPGASAVAVLSYGFWTRHFGADPGVLNQTVNLNGHPLTIVGVAAPDFQGLAVGEAPAVFVPVMMESQMMPGRSELEHRRSMWLNVMARLKPGVTRASAESAMNAFWKPILEAELKEIPQTTASFRDRFLNRHVSILPAANGISGLRQLFGTPLVLLMGLVGLVLLIACANVANLLIARAAGRQKEIAIRLALGASRANIIRQILAESMALAIAGGALGVVLAIWTGGLLLRLLPIEGVTDAISASVDPRILAFTAAISLASAILFGLAPALQSTRPNLAATLKAQASNVMGSASQLRFRKSIVVAQVALSLVLLIGAGLFLRSLNNLRKIDVGFRTDHMIGFSVNPTLNGYDKARSIALFDRMMGSIESLPGIRGVAATQTGLLTGDNEVSGIEVPGYEPKENDTTPNIDIVGPGYIAAIGTRLIAGRDLTAADGSSAPKVAVVNETFARAYFGNGNPLGRHFSFSGDPAKAPVEIVGLVRDGKYASLREEKQRFVFVPYAQRYSGGSMTFYVRTSQEPESATAALRGVVRGADPNLPVFAVETMEQQVSDSLFAERIVSWLSAIFGLLATLLAAIGLYGVMAYMVTQRTREIGIRMALGADRAAILKPILSEIGTLVGIGAILAVGVSIPLTRLAQSLLFGVATYDPVVLFGSTLLLVCTAMLAGYVPASRAMRVDPLTALRNE